MISVILGITTTATVAVVLMAWLWWRDVLKLKCEHAVYFRNKRTSGGGISPPENETAENLFVCGVRLANFDATLGVSNGTLWIAVPQVQAEDLCKLLRWLAVNAGAELHGVDALEYVKSGWEDWRTSAPEWKERVSVGLLPEVRRIVQNGRAS